MFDRAILCIGSQKGIRWDLASGLGRIRESLQFALGGAGVTDTNSEETEELTAIQYVQLMRDTLAATTFELDDHAVDTTIEGVPCRVLKPQGEIKGVYLHFHGGGMVAGAAFMGDVENRHIANTSNLAVISVDYRLALSTHFRSVRR